jgi:hypothetical protein|tara:strand:- start:143 stop:466 length:324 start_codon:yes stop_codon:yes gene_type:complete
MNSQTNPILNEISESIPESSTTYRYIHGPESFAEVATQASQEFLCLSDLTADLGNGLSGRTQLVQYGYENWLKDLDDDHEDEGDDNRLRLIGFLKLIIELSEELAEE